LFLKDEASLKVLVWSWKERMGGGGLCALELGRALNCLQGVAADLYCLEGSEIHDAARGFGMWVHALPKGSLYRAEGFGKGGGARRHLRSVLESVRPDIVVNPMVSLRQTLVVPIVKRFGCRYVLLVHEAAYRKGNSGLADLFGMMAQRFEIKRSDLVVAMSRFTGIELGDRGGSRQLAVMVHPAFSATVRKAVPAVVSEPATILFFGRANRSKGIERLLAAFEVLRTKIEVKLELCLGGAPSDGLRSPEGVSVWYGRLTERELEMRLAAADVVALPYENASQSGVAARAMGVGCPCVATPVGGLPEQVLHGRTGRVAKDMSAEAFAAALLEVLTAGDGYSAVVQENLRLAEDDFSWQRFAEEMLARLGYDLVQTPMRRNP
jgi:glycosyltransferase involved in cell wall biosynthesis